MLVVIAAAVLVGCVGLGGGTDPAARERARQILERWADAAGSVGAAPVTPVGDLTGQIGDWEVAVGDTNKVALMAGMVAAGDGIPRLRPADALVTWQDGTSTTVPVLSAPDALAALRTGAEPCADCTVGLVATDARLTEGPIETTRGPATGPIWEFTLEGTAVKVTRVAIAGAMVVDPLPDFHSELGLAIDTAQGSVAGTELTVGFVGAPGTGDQSCGEDYSAEPVESDLAVVVIVTRHPHWPPFGGGCSAVGAPRTAIATLAAPLGARTVLDLQQGTPVPIVLAP